MRGQNTATKMLSTNTNENTYTIRDVSAVALTRFYHGSFADVSESYSLPRRVELMRNKEELKAEMSRIVAIFEINCSRRIQLLRQRHKKELLHLARLKRQADSVVIRKGSVHRDSLFSFAFAMKTPELSNGSDRNGHTKHNSSLKHHEDEVETMV